MIDEMYGPRFESALAFAASRHRGQRRKGNGAPYISHPLAVAAIIADYGGDEDQAIAGLLHDVMEDCGVTTGEIAARYGARVGRIVEACTDTQERPKPPWRARKEAHLVRMRSEAPETKLVLGGDKLHNAASIARDLARRSVGESVWERFSASRDDILWYYRSVVDALSYGWTHELVDELGATVARIERRSS